jgi:hypothetical protein
VDNTVATPLPLSANDTTLISVAIISLDVAAQRNVRPPFALLLLLALVLLTIVRKKNCYQCSS